VKTKNGKNLKVKALVDSGCIHMEIDEQLVKDKRIQTRLINFSFEVFNADGMKNGEITKVVPLEIEMAWICFWNMTGWSDTIQKSTGRTEL